MRALVLGVRGSRIKGGFSSGFGAFRAESFGEDNSCLRLLDPKPCSLSRPLLGLHVANFQFREFTGQGMQGLRDSQPGFVMCFFLVLWGRGGGLEFWIFTV